MAVISGHRNSIERLTKAARAAGFAMAAEEDIAGPVMRAGEMAKASAPAVPGTALIVRNPGEAPAARPTGWTATLRDWLPAAMTRGATA